MKTQNGFFNLINDFNKNNIFRCPKCILIPLINYKFINNKINIETKCSNGHLCNLELNEFMEKSLNHSIYSKNCDCSKHPNFYCLKCDKYFCDLCSQLHDINKEKFLIEINKIDNFCLNHFKELIGFCFECKKNFCNLCMNEHSDHFIELNKEIELNNKKKYLFNNYEDNKKTLIKFQNQIEIILEKINKIKKNIDNQILFFDNLFSNYEYFIETNKILNYPIIKNIENSKLCENNYYFSFYSKSVELSNKFLLDLNEERKKFFEKNINFIKNFKEIKKRVNVTIIEPKNKIYIHNLILLNDNKRICVCLDNGALEIYDKETFERIIFIDEHKLGVTHINQLKDGRLVTSSCDKTLKVIELENNLYKVNQTLFYHNGYVEKSIELNNGNLCSCSYDGTFIIYVKKYVFGKSLHLFESNSTVQVDSKVYSIIQINDKELATTSSNSAKEYFLKFYCLNNTKKVTSIHNNDICGWNNNMIKYGNYLFVGGKNKILYVNCTNKIIEKIIPILNFIYTLYLVNDNMIIIGDNKGNISQLEINNNDLKIISDKKKAHSKEIHGFLALNNGDLLSCSTDGFIKVWK
jgi:WD40 repeat protein